MSIVNGLISLECFTRIEVPENGRIGNLKKSIEKISNVLSNQQNLYLVQKMIKIIFPNSKSIKDIHLKEGETIFL